MNPSSVTAMWPLVALAVPLFLALLCASTRLRNGMSAFLGLAPLPALIAALYSVGSAPLVLNYDAYAITLNLDGPGAVLLGVAAFLWIVAGACVPAFIRDSLNKGRFTVCWLLTLTGSMGIFMAADLASFFLFFAMVSLPAYGLVIHDGTSLARRAGAVYIGFALLGETLLLLGFVLLATSSGSWLISDAVAFLSASPWRDLTLALLIAGFGMKIGLVPVHFWMPLAYSATPIPAVAALSGAAVKAGVIGLIRFLPLDTALPEWGFPLVGVGLFTALFGVAIGITQSNPKAVLAYSSISQMGFIAAVFGMGQALGSSTVAVDGAFYAANHILIKGALFLAIGVAAFTPMRNRMVVLLPAALLGLSLGGLPLTGGALAKMAVKGPFGDGMLGLLATLSAAGTTLLMLHFLRRLAVVETTSSHASAPLPLTLRWLIIAASALVIPWVLYPLIGLGALSKAFAPSELWKALWPVLLGGALAWGLSRWGQRLPRIPVGDIIAAGRYVEKAADSLSGIMGRLDGFLRQWHVASLTLVTLVILLIVMMLAGS